METFSARNGGRVRNAFYRPARVDDTGSLLVSFRGGNHTIHHHVNRAMWDAFRNSSDPTKHYDTYLGWMKRDNSDALAFFDVWAFSEREPRSASDESATLRAALDLAYANNDLNLARDLIKLILKD